MFNFLFFPPYTREFIFFNFKPLTKKSTSGTSYEFSSKNKGMKRITLVFSGSQIYPESQNTSLTANTYNTLIDYLRTNHIEISYFIEQEKSYREEKEINDVNLFLQKETSNVTKMASAIRLEGVQQVYTGIVMFKEMGLKVYFDEASVMTAGQKVNVKDLIGLKLTSPDRNNNEGWYRNIFKDFVYLKVSMGWIVFILVAISVSFLTYSIHYYFNSRKENIVYFAKVYPIQAFIIGKSD
jgi:hypothetical protein